MLNNCLNISLSAVGGQIVEVVQAIQGWDKELRSRFNLVENDMNLYWKVQDTQFNETCWGVLMRIEVSIVKTQPARLFNPTLKEQGSSDNLPMYHLIASAGSENTLDRITTEEFFNKLVNCGAKSLLKSTE